MQVWAVIYHPSEFSDTLYQDALACIDSDSQTRIRKFYHREDACLSSLAYCIHLLLTHKGTLIGRLLVRKMLKDRGIPLNQVIFAKTPAGKPYIANQTTNPPIAYNITHDNGLIAMAFGPGLHEPPAFRIGIDVMKLKVPGKGRDTIHSLIKVVEDQLTLGERTLLKTTSSDEKRLEIFLWIWTLKEAYTKALGLGMGFDFKRVDFDPINRIVRVDGIVPLGWKFRMFTVPDGEDQYLGIIAEYLGNNNTTMTEVVVEGPHPIESESIQDAAFFTEAAISELRS